MVQACWRKSLGLGFKSKKALAASSQFFLLHAFGKDVHTQLPVTTPSSAAPQRPLTPLELQAKMKTHF